MKHIYVACYEDYEDYYIFGYYKTKKEAHNTLLANRFIHNTKEDTYKSPYHEAYIIKAPFNVFIDGIVNE